MNEWQGSQRKRTSKRKRQALESASSTTEKAKSTYDDQNSSSPLVYWLSSLFQCRGVRLGVVGFFILQASGFFHSFNGFD